MDGQTEGHINKQADGQTDRRTDKQTERQTLRKKDREIVGIHNGRKIEIFIDRQKSRFHA